MNMCYYTTYSYDVWGRLRNPATQTPYTPGSEPDLFLGRGYTGHIMGVFSSIIPCRHKNRNVKDDAFKSNPAILCGIIAQALSENDCSFTENSEVADFVLTLVTSTTTMQ